MSSAPFINCVSMCKGLNVPEHFMRQCTLVNILLFLLNYCWEVALVLFSLYLYLIFNPLPEISSRKGPGTG